MNMNVRLIAVGTRFQPRELERMTGLRLPEAVSPGDVATRGRYKGKSSPEGYANVRLSDIGVSSLENYSPEAASRLLAVIQAARDSGADDIKLLLVVSFKEAADFDVVHEWMSILVEHKLDLKITSFAEE